MRLTRCHLPGAWQERTSATLPAAQADHLVKVLRLRSGAELEIFDGDGARWQATLETGARGCAIARIGARLADEPAAPLLITLLQCLPRGEKMDWIVQKATELGVATIQPVLSEHSVVRIEARQGQRKMEHWRAVAIAACEQCGRSRVPRIVAPMPLEAAIAAGTGALWTLDPLAEVPLVDAARTCASDSQSGRELRLAIGPEGGFSEAETRLLAARGAHAVRLGPRILRTETAALAALALLQGLAGDLGAC